MDAPHRPAGRRGRCFSWSGALAILVLGAVALGMLVLGHSGQLQLLVASAMNPPITREAPPPDYGVRVIDEHGQPVPKFQIMLQTADRGLTIWEDGVNGQVTLSGFQSVQYRDLQAIDAVVRADSFASALARFAGADRETLFGGKASITMPHGEPVALRFRLPQGLRLPDDFVPEVYFANHRDAVQIMWNPENRRAYEGHMPDFNFLNVKRRKDGNCEFRVGPGPASFCVAIHRPGLLQRFESGPFTVADVKRGILEIPVPKPASLDVTFEPGPESPGGLPYDVVTLEVNVKNLPQGSYSRVTALNGKAGRQRLGVADLAPGVYQAAVATQAKRAGKGPAAGNVDPGF